MYGDDPELVRRVLESELERQWDLAAQAQSWIDVMDTEIAVLTEHRAGYVRDLGAAVAATEGIGAVLGVDVGLSAGVDPYEVAFGSSTKVEPVKGRTWDES